MISAMMTVDTTSRIARMRSVCFRPRSITLFDDSLETISNPRKCFDVERTYGIIFQRRTDLFDAVAKAALKIDVSVVTPNLLLDFLT